MKILNQHKISRGPNTEFIESLCVPKISAWPVNSDIIMVRHGEAFFEVGGRDVIISAPYSRLVRGFSKSGRFNRPIWPGGVYTRGWADLCDPSDPNGVNLRGWVCAVSVVTELPHCARFFEWIVNWKSLPKAQRTRGLNSFIWVKCFTVDKYLTQAKRPLLF